MATVRVSVSTVLLLSCINMCFGGYKLEVLLKRYRNPGHRLFSGECCDGSSYGCGRNPCDNVFTFCVRPFNSGFATTRNLTGCVLGEIITTTQSTASDDYTFTNHSPTVPNPLVFSGQAWPGAFQLYVGIDNRDRFSNDVQFVDSILINQELRADNLYTKEIKHTGERGTRLRVKFRASCAANFSGANCTTYCGVEGCSPEGAVCGKAGECACQDGYLGPTCSIERSNDSEAEPPTYTVGNASLGVADTAGITVVSTAVGTAFAGVFVLVVLVVSIAGAACCCVRWKVNRENQGTYSTLAGGYQGNEQHWLPGDNPTYTGVVGEHAAYSPSTSLQHHFNNTLYGSTSPPHIYETLNHHRGRAGAERHYYSEASSSLPPNSPCHQQQQQQQQGESEGGRYSVITREDIASSESDTEEEEEEEECEDAESEYCIVKQENIGSDSSLAVSSQPRSSTSNAAEEEWQHEFSNSLYQHIN